MNRRGLGPAESSICSDRTRRTRRHSVAVGVCTAFVLATGLAACGGKSQLTSVGSSPASASSTTAAATAPPATGSAPGGVSGVPYTNGLYRFSIARVSSIVAETTLTSPGGGQPADAPPGYTYYLASVTLTNTSGQQEPGVNADSEGLQNLSFAVTAQAAPALDESFTQNGQSLLGSTGPSCVPKSGSGLVNKAFVTSAGNYCRLEGNLMITGIDPASPDGGLSGPQLSPGETETVAVAYGPMQTLPATDIDLFATAQNTMSSSADSGFRLPAPAQPSIGYSN